MTGSFNCSNNNYNLGNESNVSIDIAGYKVSDTMRKGILQVSLYEGAEDEFMIGLLSSLGQLLVSQLPLEVV